MVFMASENTQVHAWSQIYPQNWEWRENYGPVEKCNKTQQVDQAHLVSHPPLV